MKSVRKKISLWLLKYILKTEDIDGLYNMAKIIIEMIYKNDLDNVIDRNLKIIQFDVRYAMYASEGESPSDWLQVFYKEAGFGKRSFVHYDLYRQMRRDRNPEISKLNYKLKRNES